MFKLYNIVCDAVFGKLRRSQIPVGSPALAIVDVFIMCSFKFLFLGIFFQVTSSSSISSLML